MEIRSSFEVNQFIELINKSPFPKEWKNRLPAKAEFPMANMRPVICWPVSFAAGNCTAVAMAFAPREVSDNWLYVASPKLAESVSNQLRSEVNIKGAIDAPGVR
jgi:hypothetical protein